MIMMILIMRAVWGTCHLNGLAWECDLKKWVLVLTSSWSGWLLELLTELKMAIYCPQGSGTLRQQLLMMHGIGWYWMVLDGIGWYCTVLHGIARYRMVLHGIAWYLMVLNGIAWYCMVLHGIAWY